MQPTKFCTGFILAIHRGNPKQNPSSQVTISRSCTILFWRSTGAIRNSLYTGYVFTQIYSSSFQKDEKPFLEVQIYIHQERMQNKQVTSSTTYFLLRFSFDDEPFHLKILPEKRYIFLRLILFIKAVEKLSSSL